MGLWINWLVFFLIKIKDFFLLIGSEIKRGLTLLNASSVKQTKLKTTDLLYLQTL